MSDRELNSNKKYHVDQNDRQNMSLLPSETCFAHRVQLSFRFAYFSRFRLFSKPQIFKKTNRSENCVLASMEYHGVNDRSGLLSVNTFVSCWHGMGS